MKNGILNSMLLVMITSIAISCTAQVASKLTPEEFLMRIENEKDNFVILDVRTSEEVEQGKIPGAMQMDFYDDSFTSQLDQLDKNTTYYVYCAVGGRSGKTLSRMVELGFKEVFDLEGGMKAWRAAGFKVD
ncbi:MAG: rhodanese-like domain-containing protein [Reichenbachiella sp.]